MPRNNEIQAGEATGVTTPKGRVPLPTSDDARTITPPIIGTRRRSTPSRSSHATTGSHTQRAAADSDLGGRIAHGPHIDHSSEVAPLSEIPGNRGGKAIRRSSTSGSAPDRINPAAEAGEEANALATASRPPPPPPIRRSRKAVASRSGQKASDTHCVVAAAATFPDGQNSSDTQRPAAVGGDHGSHLGSAAHTSHAPVVAQIVELARVRTDWMRARNRLILQGKAMCRRYVGGDKTEGGKLFETVVKGTCSDPDVILAVMPYSEASRIFDQKMGDVEKALVRLVKQTPLYAFAEPIAGFGALSLAVIIGACGEIETYKSPSAVWKRMGLAVIGGERQRKVAGVDALEHGYAPERRSMMWVIADSMSKHQRQWLDKTTGEVKKPAGPYGLYLEAEKAKQLEKGLTPIHAENRAKRHMAKRLLRDLWRAARECGHGAESNHRPDAALPLIAAE